MAIPSYIGATLDEDTNTFGDWFTKTNQIITDMGSKVVSAEANTTGASTTGNVAIVGVLSANTLAVGTSLRGGTVNTPAALTISSNTTFTGTSVTANTGSFTIGSTNFIVSANVTSFTGNTVTYNSDNTNFNGTNVNFDADNITYGGSDITFSSNTVLFAGTNLNVTSNTTIVSLSANTSMLQNATVTGLLTVTGDSDFQANVGFADGITIDGILVANVATINQISADTTLSINSVTQFSGNVSANGVITAIDFNSTSDVNLKDNINTLNNNLEIIQQINPVSFTWKDTGKGSYGVIAQEIEKILPELVSEKDGVKSVAYTQIIAFLVGAIQEQQKEIDEIKSKL